MPDIPATVTQTTNTNAPGSTDAKSVLDILLSENEITKEQYDEIQVKSASTGTSTTELLKQSKVVSDDKIARALAKFVGISYVDLTAVSFSPQALGNLPNEVIEKFQLIPFLFDEQSKTLSVAMSNPLDLESVGFIRQKTGLNIKVFAANPAEVKKAIETQLGQGLTGVVDEAIKETEEFSNKRVVDSKQLTEIIPDAPIAKIVSTILEFAVTSRASDVHIEPQEDRVRVRYRIDGILYDKLSLPRNVEEQLISRIKILAELKIDERRIPQDGRLNFKVNKDEVDLRVSTIPTVKGEKIVMRLLRKSGGVPTLQELGITGTALKSLETSTLRAHGIIIVCGPTGSGKTTTLYALLSRLNTTRVNIASLEDPVEYEIPGVNQVQINPTVGLTFASGLRAFLRQDPNIILVGEVRDKETTDLAIQAALTGHMVFTTLHTSNAAGALPRLMDLGAEPFLLASTINAIAAQRIVRRICQNCKVVFDPPNALVTEIRTVLGKLISEKDEIKLYKGKGCEKCANLGYIGRIGIYEVLVVSEKISKLILEHSDNNTIEREAIADGMITMKQDGYLKVIRGETTIEEVLRVAQE
ncbi:MAG TPA: GspE/PulE family protein [Candidatus Limnocylindrales bacterium]|nr:GspE/PulE family protein [Candidatus Limnocylindrales bacterium]